MKLQELNNREVVFIDLIVTEMLRSLNDIVNDKGMFKILDTPIGEVNVFMALPEEFINEIAEGAKYKVLNSLKDKIGPIADIIAENSPEILDELTAALRLDDEDEDEEEDM